MLLKSRLVFFLIHITLCSCKTFLFISIPFIGHITPLIRQAIELDHRHHVDTKIYIISCSNVRDYVQRSSSNTTIEFLDIGFCHNDTKFIEDMQILSSQSSFPYTISMLYQSIIEHYYPRMYEQMLSTLDNEIFRSDPLTIAVIDYVTYAGADIADHFDIPYIVNVASVLPYIGWHVTSPFDSNPAILLESPQSIHSIGTNLFFRLMFPILRSIYLVHMYFRYDRAFNTLRTTKYHLNTSVHIWSRFDSHLILVNNAFGLEYPQDLPGNVQLIAPLLNIKHRSNDYVSELSEEDQTWIDTDSRPIIYINFGTLISLTIEQIQKIYLALQSLDQYRIIWKLNHPELPSTDDFRIVPWISSSLGYLAHSNVHLFISHCGINSVYESIWLGTSILCIPIFADQQDMAQRVEDAGVGRWLHKFTFTSQQLKQTIINMFEEKQRSAREKNLQRIQAWMKLHGGIERTVDLIETVAEHGVELLVPINRSYPWYAYYNFDVYVLWLLVLILLRQCMRHCCYRRRHSSTNQSKTKIS